MQVAASVSTRAGPQLYKSRSSRAAQQQHNQCKNSTRLGCPAAVSRAVRLCVFLCYILPLQIVKGIMTARWRIIHGAWCAGDYAWRVGHTHKHI